MRRTQLYTSNLKQNYEIPFTAGVFSLYVTKKENEHIVNQENTSKHLNRSDC